MLSPGNCAGAPQHPLVRVLPLFPGSQEHPCPQGGRLPSVDAAVGTDGSTHIGSREISLHVGSVELTFLRLFPGVWPTGSGVGRSSPGEKPVLPGGKRTHPSVMFPAQAAAPRWILSFSPTDGPSPSHSLGFHRGEGMLRVQQAFGCFPSKPACQHSQRSSGFISHFPALWQFCGSLSCLWHSSSSPCSWLPSCCPHLHVPDCWWGSLGSSRASGSSHSFGLRSEVLWFFRL